MPNAQISNAENINTWISQINVHYKLAMSVDCVIFGYDGKNLLIALIHCDMPPYEGDLSLIGDLLKANESLDEAAARIIKSRFGIEMYFEQVEAFSAVNRHPLGRVVTMSYYSLIKLSDVLKSKQDSSIIWLKVSDVHSLAFDHFEILNSCLKRLRSDMYKLPIGFNLLPKKFTINQLQTLYEVVMGSKMDKRNFRRKVNSLGILKDEEESEKSVSHRPAKLYSFDQERYNKNYTLDLHLW